jgi:phosphate transport system permease protein
VNLEVRRRHERLVVAALLVVTLLVFLPLADMLWMVLVHAVPAIGGAFAARAGELPHAILGTVALVTLALVVATPFGVLGGIYLAEFGRASPLGAFLRLTADLLAGAPSVALGYAGFLLLVLTFGWGFSVLAGGVALAAVVLPAILRSTEIALRRVPEPLREASRALGASETATLLRVTLPSAFSGVVTGVLLASALGLGETAPLLYTAGFSLTAPRALLRQPVGFLTYLVWHLGLAQGGRGAPGAFVAAFLLMAFLVLLSLIARRLTGRATLFAGR